MLPTWRLEGVVLFASMAMAGFALIAIGDGVDPLWLCTLGAGMGLVYLFAIRPAKKALFARLEVSAQRLAERWHERRLRTAPEHRGFW